jgi:hypothetical protein
MFPDEDRVLAVSRLLLRDELGLQRPDQYRHRDVALTRDLNVVPKVDPRHAGRMRLRESILPIGRSRRATQWLADANEVPMNRTVHVRCVSVAQKATQLPEIDRRQVVQMSCHLRNPIEISTRSV